MFADWNIVEADISELDFSDYLGTDILTGGPPCQPFSRGGKRDGRSDEREMFPHFIRAVRGERLLADTSNGAMRELVEKMAAAGLSPKSIVNHSLVVKLVLASAVSADGDQLYPRKWNHDFIGLPIVRKEEQHRPSLTQAELGEILSGVKERYAVFFALLAGTGLRIGEALALKPGDLSPDCRVLYVRRSIWAGKEQTPKTPNAIREVDIPEPLAGLLHSYVENRTGYLFATATGGLLGRETFFMFCTPRARRWASMPSGDSARKR